MSDMMFNLGCSGSSGPCKDSSGSNKHKAFIDRRRLLEKKGYLNKKQNQHNHRQGNKHQGPPPWANRPHQPNAAHNKSSAHTQNTHSKSSYHIPSSEHARGATSKPASSTSSSTSLTITVKNSTNPEQSTSTITPGHQPPPTRTVAHCAPIPRGSAPFCNPLKYLAMDCEMVGTGPKGRNSELARCSIVSYDGDVVYDRYIKPTNAVTDYRTRWSGISWHQLVKAMPYQHARKESASIMENYVETLTLGFLNGRYSIWCCFYCLHIKPILKILSGKVVVGHAVHNDFKSLSYSHPAVLTRDTSRIPLLNQKAGFPEKDVASLKRLTKALFNRNIQTGKKGHSSVEDAKATMELYKVVEVEWERTLASK
ncbi:interferon-stimulated 20 kDa exonuclease-like 2 isoform X1 [Salmo trutta]|uniref:interferon-stimulated 20 kDa exonuclease-like 2 isoform X1 n=1 Tax=Salmo trutta TaxID=8032 RepID=UPI00113203FB|nr:interferon-stimulated 20 kDa exonuclease-like 2 isoform X1 [Salmo trutta]